MAGLVPAIHVLFYARKEGVDARHKMRQDGASRLPAGHDGA
jgi:hypothetical protein